MAKTNKPPKAETPHEPEVIFPTAADVKASTAPTPDEEPVKVRTVVRREFTQTVGPTAAAREVEPAEPPEEFSEEDEGGIIDRLLDEIEETQEDAIIRVDLLPQFSRDGKAGRGAPVTYCGDIPASLDYSRDIQMQFGGGTYRLTLKDGQRRIIRAPWVVSVLPPPRPRRSDLGRLADPQPIFRAPITYAESEQPIEIDPLEVITKQAEKFQRIRKIFADPAPPAAPAMPVGNATNTAEQQPAAAVSLQERIVEKIFESALSKDTPLLERLAEQYLTPAKESTSWLDLVVEIARPLAPLIGAGIAASLAKNPAIAAAVSQAPARPVALPAGTTRQPTPAGSDPLTGYVPEPGESAAARSPEDEEEGFHMDLIDRLVDMLTQCVQRAAADPEIIEAGYQEVVAFQQAHPLLSGFVQVLASGSPEMVMGMLIGVYPDIAAVRDNPIVLEAIEQLQQKLRGQQ